MHRVLSRPMFRIGGSIEGITSGLAPRQGYAKKGSVKQSVLDRSLRDFYEGDPTIREVRDLSDLVGYKPRGTNVYDFMTEMGLNLATTPSPGGILQQVAAASKEPYQRFLERKRSAAEQEYGSQSDLFKTFIKAGATSRGEDRGFAHRDKYAMIQENVKEQLALRDELSKLDMETEEGTKRSDEIKDEIKILKEAAADPEFSKAMMTWIKSGNNLRTLETMVKNQVASELEIDPDTDFTEGEIGKEFYNAYTKLMTEILGDFGIGIPPTFEAEGGRVGYQAGNTVMPGAMPMDQAAMPTDQGPSPKDMGAITYEELRARLPQEVSDDIVRLLANSAEALEDFAMIQTEQDINTFNKKYGVNLVLPSEG